MQLFADMLREFPAVAMILVHHSRKAAAENWIDMVSGTAGLAGAAHTVLVMVRAKAQGVLTPTEN